MLQTPQPSSVIVTRWAMLCLMLFEGPVLRGAVCAGVHSKHEPER